MLKRSAFLILFLLIFPFIASPHSGGIDAKGGHYNKKTGEYHFHNKWKSSTPSKPASLQKQFSGKVVTVTDGDTIKVLTGGKQIKVRLAEIDTPEKKQAFGQRAKQALIGMIAGKAVNVVVVDVDRYGRTVGRVYSDGLDVNAEMVKQGFAWVYRQYAKDKSLYTLEDSAKEGKLGLWAEPNPIPPWEWRRSKQ